MVWKGLDITGGAGDVEPDINGDPGSSNGDTSLLSVESVGSTDLVRDCILYNRLSLII